MAPSRIVTLTTDFGLRDSYAAELHAVLLTGRPSVVVVDVSHGLPLGDLEGALYLTERAWPAFPPGTVHMVVVDPGVGGDRRLVAIESPSGFLVGPDTGVLSSGLPPTLRPREGMVQVALPSGVQAVEISDSPLRREPLSSTFHGRDVMAPVAAALAGGRPLTESGNPIAELTLAPGLPAEVREGCGEGRIIYIDHFGNAVTNFRTADAPPAFVIEVGGRRVLGPARSYLDGEPATPIAIGGSGGYIEIAWPEGHAAERLGLRRGTVARMQPTSAPIQPR